MVESELGAGTFGDASCHLLHSAAGATPSSHLPGRADLVEGRQGGLHPTSDNSRLGRFLRRARGLLARAEEGEGPAAPPRLHRLLRIRAFLGHSTRLGRTSTSTRRSLKAEAKGEWLPGLPSPTYLDGSLPGDNGFDPLGLAEDPENLRWFVQAELVNGRWAMLGVAGMLIPEVLTKIGLINVPQWYDAGKSEYFASSSTLFVIEFILFHYVEIRRWQDIKNPGSVNQDPIFKSYSLPPHECGYPGSVFNPLNFAPTLEAKEKELANGRLAMLAFLGFLIQHNVTGKGPFDNLLQHLSDPWHNTIIQTLSS